MRSKGIDKLPCIVSVLAASPSEYIIVEYKSYVLFAEGCDEEFIPDVAEILSYEGKRVFAILSIGEFKKLFANVHFTGDIDEAAYLAKYEDVAAAVRGGLVASAREHYLIQGYLERRDIKLC
jgi:hypothetical protein